MASPLDRLRALSRNQKIGAGIGVGVVVVLIAALLIGGGSGKKTPVAVTTTTTTRPTTTTTTAAPSSPLTGLPQPDATMRARPALIAKVDNTPQAQPLQEGIDNADVVYVEQVEQGVTRMAVVFQSKDDTVGPVRSARTTDLEIAGDLNNPYFCYSGANGGVLRMVRGGPMTDMGVDRVEATPVYKRNTRGSGVHRFFLPTKEIYAVGRQGAGSPPSLFTFRAKGVAATGEAANGVQIGYGGGAATVVKYAWNGTGWARSSNGRPQIMADSKVQVAPANVVVQFVQYKASGFVDVVGASSPEAELVGSGEAWIFTGGKLVRGRWSRATRDVVTSYTDAGGQPIALTPGQTFVELAPGAGSAHVL